MGELVELDVTTVEESVTVNVTEEGAVQVAVFAETGPAGPAGPNSVTSATTSDGTCDLSLDTLTVGLSTASGVRSVAIGQSTASGSLSFASGASTASNDYCFANGDGSTASGYASTASGTGCTASGYASDASGDGTVSSGYASTASGSLSTATGDYSIALGRRAKAIHNGASVEADSQDADVESTTTNQKTFRFANGYRFLGGSVTITGTANVSGNTTSSGHFASVPTGGEAGHFVSLNGTAPTVVAGRSAWWSDGSGTPSFRNGTGTAVTLIRSSDLGTGVGTFLATPTSANLAAAVTDETGTGSLVFGTSPTLTTPTIAQINGGTAANDDLTLQGTTNATRTTSYVILQPNGGNVGIGTSTPNALFEINSATLSSLRVNNSNSTTGAGASQLQFFASSSPSAFNQKNFSINNLNGLSALDENQINIQSRNDDGTFKANLFRVFQATGNVTIDIGSLGIGTISPNARAILDLTSTVKGFLPPRMTTTERNAISSPPAGLMIYNTTTNKLNVFTTAWEAITSA